jgi:hypothetical protein
MQNYSHYIAPVLLLVFLVARKIMRTIGFQKFSQPRLIIRIVLLSMATVVFLITAALHPISYLIDLGGAISGLALLFWSMRHSVFEKRGNDFYYRTNIWIELLVFVLFLSRLISRISLFYQLFSTDAETPAELKAKIQSLRDPYTGALIFILFAYYIGYSVFVLKKVAELKNQNADAQIIQQ